MRERRSEYDVTNTVHLANPSAVREAVCDILARLYPRSDLAPVRRAFDIFTKLYAGLLPGWHGCDTWYHDAQHPLDTTLAMARLLDGYERDVEDSELLGERRARLGIICALFHDAGYTRRRTEPYVKGGELTLTHVTRSGDILAELLPSLGFALEANLAKEIVHYTGYEKPLADIPVYDPKDRMLGFLLGTADLFAQMSDRCYPEKCRRYLYHEFQACGLAGAPRPNGPKPIYDSPEDLIRKTPKFAESLFNDRLDGYFKGAYRYFERHFDGKDPYLHQIEKHLAYVRKVIERGDWDLLRRRPRTLNARQLRRVLGVRLADVRPGRESKKASRAFRRHAAKIAKVLKLDRFIPI